MPVYANPGVSLTSRGRWTGSGPSQQELKCRLLTGGDAMVVENVPRPPFVVATYAHPFRSTISAGLPPPRETVRISVGGGGGGSGSTTGAPGGAETGGG